VEKRGFADDYGIKYYYVFKSGTKVFDEFFFDTNVLLIRISVDLFLFFFFYSFI
jgi:hypothetical protein